MTTKLFLGGAFLSLLLVAGCSGTRAVSFAVTCDEFAGEPSIEQVAEIAAGTAATISLCSNPTTGFAWEETIEISNPAVVRVSGRTYEPPADASRPVVGAAGTEAFTLDDLATGTATVFMRYSQPWDGGQKNAWTYTLTLTVR